MTTNTTEAKRLSDRELFYFRQRQKNRVYQAIMRHFAQQAEERGLTKSDIAFALGKDRSSVTRWFSGPANLELDTISDLLLAMGAEMDHEIVSLDEANDGETDSLIRPGSPNAESHTSTGAPYPQIVEFG